MSDRRYYRARLVKDGPFVPVMVWRGQPVVDGEELDRSPRWQCLVGVEKTSRGILMGDDVPIEVDGVLLRGLEAISQDDYAFMVEHVAWAEKHAPDHPKAAPKRAVNFNTIRLPF